MFGIKSFAKRLIGRVGAVAYPSLTKEIHDGNIGGPKHELKKLIAQAEFARLQAKGANEKIQEALTRRWTPENLNADYYDEYADRFETMFFGPHARIIDWLQSLSQEVGITHVIEVGCGDGRALSAMSKRIPEIARWTGVDINAAIIARNHETYAEQSSLEFVVADAAEWLQSHIGPGTLLMTYGGVMEYIAPETLSNWFTVVAKNNGAGVLLTEPVDHSHDLSDNPNSYLWGYESSYSHNHRALLEDAGFSILQMAEETLERYRTVMMLAAPKPQESSGVVNQRDM